MPVEISRPDSCADRRSATGHVVEPAPRRATYRHLTDTPSDDSTDALSAVMPVGLRKRLRVHEAAPGLLALASFGLPTLGAYKVGGRR
jgi:hypothetical protein